MSDRIAELRAAYDAVIDAAYDYVDAYADGARDPAAAYYAFAEAIDAANAAFDAAEQETE